MASSWSGFNPPSKLSLVQEQGGSEVGSNLRRLELEPELMPVTKA